MTAEYYTEERCHILELLNTPDEPGASIARARVEPGVTTCNHRVAATVERYAVLQGQGIAHVEGTGDVLLQPGVQVTIPAGNTQSVTNTGTEDLVFLCICTPRFEWDNYASLDQGDS